MTTLHASPYNPDARGFNFASSHIFNAKADKCFDAYGNAVEEFEIIYIEGDDGQLFDACRINQTNLDVWFDTIEDLKDYEKAALYYLTNCAGYRLNEALEKIDDVSMYEGTLIDAASELFDDCYLPEVPESVRPYVDYEAFARDCRLGGDMCEFELNGSTWTCTNANGV